MPPDPLRKNQLFSEERTDISFSSLPDGKSASRNNTTRSSRARHGGPEGKERRSAGETLAGEPLRGPYAPGSPWIVAEDTVNTARAMTICTRTI